MVYGKFGVGKTSFLASAEEVLPMNSILLADAEKGSEVLSTDSQIDIVGINSYAEFIRLYDFCVRHCKYRDAGNTEALQKLEAKFFHEELDLTRPPTIYHTVLIDSITEIQKFCLYQLIGIDRETFNLMSEPERMQRQEWGTALDMVLLMVRAFRDLPMHTLWAAQRGETQDEKGRRSYAPRLQGQAQTDVQGFFDFVGYYKLIVKQESHEIYRRLYLAPVGNFQAKNRFVKLTAHYLDNPTLSTLLSYKS